MVHQYKLNGYNIVLDTASGSVHTVDEVAYDIIEMYKTHTPEQIVSEIMSRYGHLDDVNEGEILECIDDIRSLEEAGKLFRTRGGYARYGRKMRALQGVRGSRCLPYLYKIKGRGRDSQNDISHIRLVRRNKPRGHFRSALL